jgi:hypothetical protein
VVDDDARIGGDGAVLVDDQRVEVEFLIHGSSQTISEMQSSTSFERLAVTGGMLRNWPRIFEARVDSIRSLRQERLSGGRATERSLKISTSCRRRRR